MTLRFRLSLAALFAAVLSALFAAGCGGPTMSSPHEYADDKPISVEAGAEYFLHTGGGDPYATGMALPVFLGLMNAYPEELGKDFAEFADKFGFNIDPTSKEDPKRTPPVGFHLTTDPNTNVPWLVGNCTMCHSERIRLETGDIVVPGLGSKRVRPHAYVSALMHIGTDPGLDDDKILAYANDRAREWKIPWPEQMRAPIVKATLAAFRKGTRERAPSVKRFENALPGRMATIESFALALNAYPSTNPPIPPTANIGWAKVPDVRSFPFRETFSYDGSGYGSPQALTLEADFLFGARPEWYLSHPHIATSVYLYLRNFTRHLPYPKPIDAALAARGKAQFEAHCSQCHGFYVDHGDEMRVSYKEKIVPKSVVGTDPARVDAVTPEFVKAANDFPLTKGYTRVRQTGGYVPPILLDVWARGILGHAGQWPSIEVMATPPAERPKHFVVDTNGLYDLDRLGVRYDVLADGATPPSKPGTYVYDGTKIGFGVQGHPFLADLPPADRRAVMEYLKTL